MNPSDTVRYNTTIRSIVVRPVGASVNDSMATDVGIDDEGGGPFVCIKQERGSIAVTQDDWPVIREAIDRMMVICIAEER